MLDGNPSDEAFRVELAKHNFSDLSAGAYTEASVYSLNNPYLSRMQKVIIKAVFQLLIGVFSYAFIVMLIVNGAGGWFNAYLTASAVSIPFWAISWFIPGRFTASLGTFFAGSFCTIGCLVLAGIAAYQGLYVVAGIAAIISIGGNPLLLISPPMWLYNIFSKELDPKYILAKKMWGVIFPFEKYMRQQEKI